MLDYFTGDRSWVEFYDFLHELPKWGKFQSALSMDRDYALLVAAHHKEHKRQQEELEQDEDYEPEWKPQGRSPEGYTPELDVLYRIEEGLQSISRILIMVNSKSKPPEIQKNRRPVTMLDLMDLEDEREDMNDLASKFGIKKP